MRKRLIGHFISAKTKIFIASITHFTIIKTQTKYFENNKIKCCCYFKMKVASCQQLAGGIIAYINNMMMNKLHEVLSECDFLTRAQEM